jgi:hypothetical protein
MSRICLRCCLEKFTSKALTGNKKLEEALTPSLNAPQIEKASPPSWKKTRINSFDV